MNIRILLTVVSFLSAAEISGAAPADRSGSPYNMISQPVMSTTAVGSERVQLQASQGEVTFPHRKHQDMLKDCSTCHGLQPGKIAGMGKTWAHNTCRGCHGESARAPVQCIGCHSGSVPVK